MDIVRESGLGILLRAWAPNHLRYPEEDRPALRASLKLDELPQAPLNDTIICTWEGENDPGNPINWRLSKKAIVVGTIVCYALVVYMSAPIWTPGEDAFREQFGLNYEYTTLGLALYVLGYGVGPLLFAPLSEIPSIGRNPPYILTFVLFMLVTIPTALVLNAPAFMFLRFLQGFFGSPVLAAGGASITDVYDDAHKPIGLTVWSLACFVAPAISPIIAGAAVPYFGWPFTIWETLIASAPVMLLLLVIPETSSATILYYRARRLRIATGDTRIQSESAKVQAEMSFGKNVTESLLVPAKITLQDPAVLFTNIYLILIYGIYYSFFESFPLVYNGIYGFDLLQQGLAFIPIAIGTFVGFGGYQLYLWLYRRPRVLAGVSLQPEHILVPAMFASLFPPAGLFLFGWLSRSDIHWIAPMFGVAIYCGGVFVVFQNLHVYMAICYPRFAASLFAATDFTRSAFAVGAIMAGRPLYITLGIGGGSSLLAGLMSVCVFGVYALHRYGPILRARSKFTTKL